LRPGFQYESFLKDIKHLEGEYKAKIHIADAPQIQISSSCIRRMIGNNQSIRYLLPDSVGKYITEKKLFIK